MVAGCRDSARTRLQEHFGADDMHIILGYFIRQIFREDMLTIESQELTSMANVGQRKEDIVLQGHVVSKPVQVLRDIF